MLCWLICRSECLGLRVHVERNGKAFLTISSLTGITPRPSAV
jgi:hypothetical protein